MEVIGKQRGHLYAKVYVNKAKLRVVLSPSVKSIEDLHLDGKHNKYFFRIFTSMSSGNAFTNYLKATYLQKCSTFPFLDSVPHKNRSSAEHVAYKLYHV